MLGYNYIDSDYIFLVCILPSKPVPMKKTTKDFGMTVNSFKNN